MPSSKIAVFGVPTAAGGRATGLERAPFALREAGLLAGPALDDRAQFRLVLLAARPIGEMRVG